MVEIALIHKISVIDSGANKLTTIKWAVSDNTNSDWAVDPNEICSL